MNYKLEDFDMVKTIGTGMFYEYFYIYLKLLSSRTYIFYLSIHTFMVSSFSSNLSSQT